MHPRVEVRSDHDYIGHPLAFDWHGLRLEVTEIISQTRNPDGYTFRVLNQDFGIFELNYEIQSDHWSVNQL
jgi:hypothetical protein